MPDPEPTSNPAGTPGLPQALHGYTRSQFTALGKTRDVYQTGSGPAVIVISEIPGITPKVAEFGRRVASIGCTAILPHLFGEPGAEPTIPYAMKVMAHACISREFSTLARGRTSPITAWLRVLATDAHGRCGGPGVGAVGMCLTGGFALAMMVDDVVLAPVLSQPSLPFPLGSARKRDLGLSDADLSRVKQRCEDEDICVLGLRFTGDQAAPADRFRRLKAELGDRFVAVEIDSSPGNPDGYRKAAHSVLTEDLKDEPGTATRDALDQVLTLFRERLLVPST
ncbi:MAG: dienelactone hydrolase family protein [Acidimicrobiales bacterium]|jgi:dienelactone hydrolase